MSDRTGDKSKQPEECHESSGGSCPFLRETSSPRDMDGETYDCEMCGLHYRLYYEDMK